MNNPTEDDILDNDFYLVQVEKAPSKLLAAQTLLRESIYFLRHNTQFNPELACYLADCLEKALAEPPEAQAALNLKKPTTARDTEHVRNYYITEAITEKIDEGMSLSEAAKTVVDECKLPFGERRAANIYKDLKATNEYLMWQRLNALEKEDTASE